MADPKWQRCKANDGQSEREYPMSAALLIPDSHWHVQSTKEWIPMATKTVTRIAVIAATIGIAGLPLTISAPASAITKPEPSGSAPAEPVLPPAGSDRNLDLAQLGAGTLAGIALTGAGFAAAARLRHHKPFSNSTSVKTPIAR
jgi:hypothetical protein